MGADEDKNFIRTVDKSGREVLIDKETWRSSVLPRTLKEDWDDPAKLYVTIVEALGDGFLEEALAASEHLFQIDPVPTRGAVVYAIALMKLHRLQDAQKVLDGHLRSHPELSPSDRGIVLTNLAKVYWEQGDRQKSEKTLRDSIELDPNQENGLGWFLSMQRGRGEKAYRTAMEWACSLPGGWLPQLWLAQFWLDKGELAHALSLFHEAIAAAGRPVPEGLLMTVSGELGKHGHLRELISIVEPLFDINQHGVRVWNNLVKAHLDLGQTDAALALLDQADSLNRLDFYSHIVFWKAAIKKAQSATVQ